MKTAQMIKQSRIKSGLTQEELAEKLYVSRQSVSNWENGKNEPDLENLRRMADLFHLPAEKLIWQQEASRSFSEEEQSAFRKQSMIFTILFLSFLLLAFPLIFKGGIWGIVLAALLYAILMAYALRVETMKKKIGIRTWKEITAFDRGEALSYLEHEKQKAVFPYQKVLLGIGAGILTALIGLAFLWIMGMI